MSNNFPIIILTTFFDAQIVGFFSLSLRVIQTPISVISTSISQVFNQKLSEKYNQGMEIFLFTKNIVKKLLLFEILPLLIFGVFSPYIFSVIFGGIWYEAGIYSRLLIPWFFMTLLVSPISYLPSFLGKQKTAFILSIILVCISTGMLLIGCFMGDIYLALNLFSLSNFFILAYNLKWYFKIAKNLNF